MKKTLSLYWLLLSLATSIFSFVIPIYLKSAGYGDSAIGVLFSVSNFVSVFMLIAASAHSDAVGLKKYLMAFSAAVVAASLVLFVPGPYFFAFLLLSLTLTSLVGKSFYVFGKVATISFFGGEMGHTYGLFGVAISLGGFLGPIIGGNLTDSYGFPASLVFSGIMAAFSFLAAIRILEPRPEKGSWFSASSLFGFRFTARSAVFTTYRTLLNMSFTMVSGFVLPLFMKGEFNNDLFLAGIAVSAFSLGRILGFGLGKYTDRHDFNRVNFAALLFEFLVLILFVLTGGWLMVLMLLMVGLGSGLSATTLPGFYSRISSKLGRDIGIIDTFGIGIGATTAYYLSGVFATSFGYRSVFLAGAVACAISALLVYPFFKDGQK